jgi:protein SCO1
MHDSTYRRPWVIISAVIIVAFSAGATLSYLHTKRADATLVEGLLWPDPPVLDSIHLLDHEGTPFTLDQLRGKWSLLFFGFTSCPDVCPTTLDQLARAHEHLKSNERYRANGQIIFVSVDPDRDSPERLREYVKYFHEDFIGITASETELKALTARLGALFMKVSQGGDDYTVDHSAGIFFIDPALRLISVVTPPHSASEIVRRFDAVSTYIAATL